MFSKQGAVPWLTHYSDHMLSLSVPKWTSSPPIPSPSRPSNSSTPCPTSSAVPSSSPTTVRPSAHLPSPFRVHIPFFALSCSLRMPPPYAPCPGMFVLRPGVMCSSTAVQTLSSAVFRTRVDQLGKPVWGNAAAHGCTPDLLVSTTMSQPMAEESYVALLHDRVHLN